jgi:hypothetical protein
MTEIFEGFLYENGLANLAHSGRKFIYHLKGTKTLLESWGCSEDVSNAGFFHSIYSTEFFDHEKFSFDRREELIELIGVKAEELCYLFCCAINRSQTFLDALSSGVVVNRFNSEIIEVNQKTLVDLITIECANLIEQKGSRTPFLETIVSSRNMANVALRKETIEATRQYVLAIKQGSSVTSGT